MASSILQRVGAPTDDLLHHVPLHLMRHSVRRHEVVAGGARNPSASCDVDDAVENAATVTELLASVKDEKKKGPGWLSGEPTQTRGGTYRVRANRRWRLKKRDQHRSGGGDRPKGKQRQPTREGQDAFFQTTSAFAAGGVVGVVGGDDAGKPQEVTRIHRACCVRGRGRSARCRQRRRVWARCGQRRRTGHRNQRADDEPPFRRRGESSATRGQHAARGGDGATTRRVAPRAHHDGKPPSALAREGCRRRRGLCG